MLRAEAIGRIFCVRLIGFDPTSRQGLSLHDAYNSHSTAHQAPLTGVPNANHLFGIVLSPLNLRRPEPRQLSISSSAPAPPGSGTVQGS
ncbi:hypothetical protein TWF679_009072 [Orbilia oligospora]|uniref:Uncharacterized protein n=1 Tax=Orbilia oligospora TaxID=2813651 RepID=A0A8H8V3W0_ORBOL|nr:hypothetical protein TWF679_009072 [Orbilia oligospora]